MLPRKQCRQAKKGRNRHQLAGRYYVRYDLHYLRDGHQLHVWHPNSGLLADYENIRNIDPRLLPDHLRGGLERVKSSLSDNPEAGHSERRVSAWRTRSGTNLKALEADCILITEPQLEDYGLSYTGLLDVKPHEPMIADCFHQQGQEVTEIHKSPLSEAITTSALTMMDSRDGSPQGITTESLSPSNLLDDEDVRQVQLAELIQYPAKEEKDIDDSPTQALMPDPKDLSNAAKLYWGRGYALVPKGCELNRTTNNAQRREEISSNISSRYVITGRRLRSRVNKMRVGAGK